MSDQEAMRKAVEEKKRKLEELKAKRMQRSTTASQQSGSAATTTDDDSTNKPTKVSVDAILNSVSSLLPTTPTPSAGASMSASTTTTTTTTSRKVQLSVSTQPIVTIPPIERIAYDVGIQTDPPPLMDKDGIAPADAVARLRQLEQERTVEHNAWATKESELTRQLETLLEEKKKLHADQTPKPLSAAEQATILSSSSFQSFFKHASLVMERALDSGNAKYDYTVDYSQDEAKDASTSSETRVIARHHFHDVSRTSSRPITSLHWSPKYKELLLASYAGHEDELSTEPDGTVLVWNLHMSKRPEYYFTCQSAVLSAQFHPTEARHIIGGTASGQLVMWDTREKSTPVNRSSLSYGHTHPIFALQIITLVNGLHQIVSVSTDGHLCIWNDTNLHKPQHEIYLKMGKDEITTNSFDFPGRDTQNVVLGSDEGAIYKAHIYDKDNIYETIQAHDAPITAIEFHPSHKNTHAPVHLQDLFLTASYDWTVKLWSNKLQRPLYTMESAKDYVYDVKWSPKNPALFAMGDGMGRLDFWNLLTDTEVPYHSIQIDDNTANDAGQVAPPRDQSSAVSRLSWSDDGTQLAVGTSTGSVHIYEVAPEMSNPSRDDMNAFYDKIGKRTLGGAQ